MSHKFLAKGAKDSQRSQIFTVVGIWCLEIGILESLLWFHTKSTKAKIKSTEGLVIGIWCLEVEFEDPLSVVKDLWVWGNLRETDQGILMSHKFLAKGAKDSQRSQIFTVVGIWCLEFGI